MRQKRAKAYRKLMHVYSINFGFRQPYQVLVEIGTDLIVLYPAPFGTCAPVDAEICSEAASSKVDLVKQLTMVLQGTVKPMITQCSIHRLYLAGKAGQPAVDLAKTFERRRCNHKEAKPAEECVNEVIGTTNKHRYVLATQSTSLRQHARQVPGVPIVHIKRTVMVLEPASEATEKAKITMETERMGPTEAESSKLASTLTNPSTSSSEPPKKMRGPRGPNPLSVKKKKPKESNRQSRSIMDGTMVTEKRKRSDEEEDSAQGQGETGQERANPDVTSKRKRKRTRKRKHPDEARNDNAHAESPVT